MAQRTWCRELAVAAVLFIVFLPSNSLAFRDVYNLDNDTIMRLLDWNKNAVARIPGCAPCEMGDESCSLGGALAAEKGRMCGFQWPVADYYGYNDKDDDRYANNPYYLRYDWIWDTKWDYESGIPDIAIVKESVESIETYLEAYWVWESKWLFPPNWMHLYDPGPGSDQVDWQDWLMPCKKEGGETEYWCRWSQCKKAVYQPGGSCPCSSCPGSCTVAGVPTVCTADMCDLVWVDQGNYCNTSYSGEDYQNGGNPQKEGNLCCWTCDPANVGPPHTVIKGPDEGASFCGVGGAVVEKNYTNSTTFYYFEEGNLTEPQWTSTIMPGYVYPKWYGYPRLRDIDGIDINDDIRWFDIKASNINNAFYFPGTHPPNVLPDEDFVVDRYWKHNATNIAFHGSRPGYCAFEGWYSGGTKSDCIEGGPRDDILRPASRQHDPCVPCGGFDYIYLPNDNPEYCSAQCFNYDIRYYRQFDIDSVWANIFKITPETHTPYDEDLRVPDTIESLCFDKIPAPDLCTKKYVHERCHSDSDCISSLVCMNDTNNPSSASKRRCCPDLTENIRGCCRELGSQYCTDFEVECPVENRVDPNHPTLGVGENGCGDQANDLECGYYIDAMDHPNPAREIDLHCSKGGW